MILFPPAKINIGLSVVAKRSDGFHDLESVFLATPLTDILEVIPSQNSGLNLELKGFSVSGELSDNLVSKAYELMHSNYNIPGVDAVLFKQIPMGAGLGGGSADAAYMLKALVELFEIQISKVELLNLAAQLGSDCPFFIDARTSLVTGRGDIMRDSGLSLKGYFLVLVHPGIHVSTPWAYSKITPQGSTFDLKKIVDLPIEQWQNLVVNDFEKPVFTEFPEILSIRDKLIENGALYASMSGSGSACYGIYREPMDAEALFPGMFTWAGWL